MEPKRTSLITFRNEYISQKHGPVRTRDADMSPMCLQHHVPDEVWEIIAPMSEDVVFASVCRKFRRVWERVSPARVAHIYARILYRNHGLRSALTRCIAGAENDLKVHVVAHLLEFLLKFPNLRRTLPETMIDSIGLLLLRRASWDGLSHMLQILHSLDPTNYALSYARDLGDYIVRYAPETWVSQMVRAGFIRWSDIKYEIAARGDTKYVWALRTVCENEENDDDIFLDAAIENNHDFMFTHRVTSMPLEKTNMYLPTVLRDCACHKRLTMLKFVGERFGYVCPTAVLLGSIMTGEMDYIKYIANLWHITDIADALATCSNGDVEYCVAQNSAGPLCEWIRGHYKRFSPKRCMVRALYSGNHAILRLLLTPSPNFAHLKCRRYVSMHGKIWSGVCKHPITLHHTQMADALLSYGLAVTDIYPGTAEVTSHMVREYGHTFPKTLWRCYVRLCVRCGYTPVVQDVLAKHEDTSGSNDYERGDGLSRRAARHGVHIKDIFIARMCGFDEIIDILHMTHILKQDVECVDGFAVSDQHLRRYISSSESESDS